MKKIVLISLLLCTGFLWAQEVPENPEKTKSPALEDKEIRVPAVNFINRNNNPASDVIRQRDRDLGSQLATDLSQKQEASADGIVIKRVFDSTKPGFGADIITITPKATYGHVNSLQRILTGYLMKSFEYNEADANLVSRFLLYYNARQRGKIDTVKTKYSEQVTAALDPKKLGIDRTYRNWAGKTEMIVPLSKNVVRPDKTDLNTNEVKKDSDATKKEKQEMDDLEKKRKEEDAKKLKEKEEALKKQQDEVNKKKEEVTKQKDEVQKQKEESGKKLEELRKDPVKNADAIKKEEQKQQDIVKKEQEVKKQEDTVKKEEQKVKEEQKEVAEQKNPETKKEETATTTKTEEQKKTEDLEKKVEDLQKKVEEKEEISSNVVGEKILFLKVLRFFQDGHYNNELWYIDTANDDTLLKSPFNNICGQTFEVVEGQGVVVIGYEGGQDEHKQAHKLVLLDQDKLVLKKTSAEEVHWRSPLIFQQGKLHVIEIKDGNYYLTRFNPDLTLDARSSDPINEDSTITFYKEKIYVTGKPKTGEVTTIKVFNKADLKILKSIEK